LSLFYVFQTGSGAHPAPYPMGTGVKWPGREAGRSPPTSDEVKKIWVYTSVPPYAFIASAMTTLAFMWMEAVENRYGALSQNFPGKTTRNQGRISQEPVRDLKPGRCVYM
jgi:hypothetical protein